MRKMLSLKTVALAVVLVACVGVPEAQSSEAWVPPPAELQFFAVIVEDVDKSVGWYKTAFGLKELDDTEASDGRWRIVNLRNRNLFVEIIRDKRSTEASKPRGFSKVGFEVPDVEIVAARVEKATKERPRVVTMEKHGFHILQLKDPEGNVVQLVSEVEE